MHMTGEDRRNEMIKVIKEATTPISGTALAKKFQVSRQIVVQDIAILRAADYRIFSTPKGYILETAVQNVVLGQTDKQKGYTRVYHVSHSDEQIEEELNSIVDMGGRLIDVFVEHEIYGVIKADLPIHCRRHVQEFMEGILSGKSSPLKNLKTGGVHYHTVEADCEKTLDLIEGELRKKGFLVS